MLDEAAPRNVSDFTKVSTSKSGRGDAEKQAFYKLIMTLSNYHSTVSDLYLLQKDDKRAKYHQELSLRFRNEANSFKV